MIPVNLNKADIDFILYCLGYMSSATDKMAAGDLHVPYIRRHHDELLPKLIHANERRIVCLCGSSRFVREIALKSWELEKKGLICLSLHLLPGGPEIQPDHQAEHEGVAKIMDEVHLAKIDLADYVYVMNVNGYTGERTKVEIEYARKRGKPVEFLNPEITSTNGV